MAITHVNRKGQTYYLHIGKTPTGKPKYQFSKSSEGALVDQFPEGYEVREQLTGQVSLRLAKPKLITDQELQIVERELAKVVPANRGYVNRDGKVLTVNVANTDDRMEEILQRIGGGITPSMIESMMTSCQRYESAFRFILLDGERRTFQTERFCYRGSVDDWIHIGNSGPLEYLARLYLQHVGQESYFDLI